jgi:hypothetical protein
MANNTVTEAKGKVGEAADKAVEHGKDLAAEAAAKARDVAGSLADAGRTAASGMADAGRSAARSAGQAADSATTKAGEKIESLAGTVREYGPHSGVMGSATETVAQGLERGGRYLEDQGLSGLTNDLTDMVKRNPIPALLFGIGLGFVLARLTSSRS